MLKTLLAVAGVVAVGAVAYTLINDGQGSADHPVVDGELPAPDTGGEQSTAPAI
ncbi:hypothetical protein Xoosp14_193 [Xanthomonas phage Xoo-sp14]|nr:hypothetical protein Xoosp14_193 [Xanthomonas phage Xoo-sp14]